MLAVVYSAFVGGILSGSISAGLAILHGVVTSLEPFGSPLPGQESLSRLMVFALVLPVAALLVGHLRRRLDWSERRQSEEIVRQTRMRLDMVAQATTDSVWDWDLETDQIWWSNGTGGGMGGMGVLISEDMSRVEMNSTYWSDRIHPDDRDRVLEKLTRFIAGGESQWQDEYRFLRADGTTADIVDRGHAIRSEDGRAIRMVGAMSDVTERKQAELALRHSEAKFRAAFDNVLDAMVIFDDNHRYRDANPAACEMFGLAREQIVGRRIDELMAPEVSEAADDISRGRLTETVLRGEWIVKQPDGGVRHLEYVTSADFMPGLHLCIARDMTARRILMEQRSQAQKMEAIGRLAGGIAHDFNNLLTVIRGYADFQLAVLPAQSPVRGDLAEIARAADRAAGLTMQLLAFSRRQVLEMKVLDLNKVVSGIADMIRRIVGESISVEITAAGGLHLVMADPGQMEQVLLNLALNARDAMPRGGRLSITTANLDPRPDRDSPQSTLAGSCAVLDVEDDGIGMDDDTLAHVFEPFFTTKARDRGTGLGMSTVYGIVKQSGGDVQIRSRPGQGTRVRIVLPRTEATQADAGQVGAADPADAKLAALPARGHEVILLVEDDPSVRELARRALASTGYRIIEADCGPAAIAAARGTGAEIDLLLTDVVMPGMSGKDLYEKLAAFLPRLRVLYTSGYAEEAVTNHGIPNGRRSLLPKPFTPEMLRRKVRDVLAEAGESLDRGKVGN